MLNDEATYNLTDTQKKDLIGVWLRELADVYASKSNDLTQIPDPCSKIMAAALSDKENEIRRVTAWAEVVVSQWIQKRETRAANEMANSQRPAPQLSLDHLCEDAASAVLKLKVRLEGLPLSDAINLRCSAVTAALELIRGVGK